MSEDKKNPTLMDASATLDNLADAIETVVESAEAMPLTDATKVYWRLKQGYDAVDKARKRVYALLDKMAKFVLPKLFDEADLDLIRIPELERSFYPNTKWSARTLDKERLMDWLRKEGQEDLISETVNASTLAGFLKDRLLNEGMDPPEEIVQLTNYKTVGSSKYTPK